MARQSMDFHFPRKPLPPPMLPEEYVERLRKYLRQCHDIARGPPEAPAQFDPTPLVKPGDWIVVSVTPLHYRHKFAPKWEGPFCVLCVPNRFPMAYEMRGQDCTAHINHTKKYTPRDGETPIPLAAPSPSTQVSRSTSLSVPTRQHNTPGSSTALPPGVAEKPPLYKHSGLQKAPRLRVQ